jgi:quercetin dioxygenase-like cupin family protein
MTVTGTEPAEESMAKPIRRIVTGHDSEGHSIILMDGPPPTVMTPATNVRLTDLWETTGMPASNAGSEDASLRPVRLIPPKNGSIFRIVEFPPDRDRKFDNREAAFAAMGAAHALDRGKPRHPGFHKTNTVDYAVVIEGEIWAMVDVGETLMKAGDTLVQRGTNHSWSNRSDEPCRVAFILLDADPA